MGQLVVDNLVAYAAAQAAEDAGAGDAVQGLVTAGGCAQSHLRAPCARGFAPACNPATLFGPRAISPRCTSSPGRSCASRRWCTTCGRSGRPGRSRTTGSRDRLPPRAKLQVRMVWQSRCEAPGASWAMAAAPRQASRPQAKQSQTGQVRAILITTALDPVSPSAYVGEDRRLLQRCHRVQVQLRCVAVPLRPRSADAMRRSMRNARRAPMRLLRRHLLGLDGGACSR